MNDDAPTSGTQSTPHILALGEAMIELNQPRVEAQDAYLRGFGGDTSNMAVAAARLSGGNGYVGYVTRVGDDAFGGMLLDMWRRERIDTSGVAVDGDTPTGVYFVTHGTRGHEFAYLRTGSAASQLSPANLPVDLIRSARVLHVSGISQAISTSACDAVFAAIEIAQSVGAAVSYDSNLRRKLWPLPRARAIIMATVAQCNWFLPSLDEAMVLSGQEDDDAVIDWCHVLGAPIVALKRGAAGVIVSDGHRTERIGGHAVDAVDATGAGDCFDGAFVARLCAGDDPFAAARYANAAAALATTGYGAVAPLPRDDDVRSLLDAHATNC